MCQKGVSPRGYMMESGVWNKESEKVSCFKDVIFFCCALESVERLVDLNSMYASLCSRFMRQAAQTPALILHES
jgi:hypothetical protein